MPKYLPDAEPFFFDGNSIGCLLIHGFGGTPYEMRGLGTFLNEQFGYTVLGPALAGHATTIEEMARTNWRDWYSSAEKAYNELAARCDQVFSIGLSLGGVLTLHLAAHKPLAGAVALSSPIYIKHRFAFWFSSFPILFDLIPFIKGIGQEDDTQDPTIAPVHPGYGRTSTRCARSLILHLLPQVRADLPTIKTPVLLLQARGDRTIPPESISLIYKELGSPDKQMTWIDKGGHLSLEDYGKEQAFKLIADFITQHLSQTASLAARQES